MGTNRVRIVALSAVVLDGMDPPEHRQFLEGQDPIPVREASPFCGYDSWRVVLERWIAHSVSSIGLDHERPHEHLEVWAWTW